jgi:26S proteasome regulatory subunit N8
VPFEEDASNPKIWFLDHNYHESMYSMFKKVNGMRLSYPQAIFDFSYTARENVVGWYSSGPKMRENDLEIHEVFRRYHPNPVMVIIDVQLKEELEIPTKAYVTVDEIRKDGTVQKKFEHLPAEIGALEAEEVGVEHLLRDVKVRR